jgi:hypothetical protein
MEEKLDKGRKYLICFKKGQSWNQVFSQYPEEKTRIKKAYLEAPDTWRVAFNERRIERAVKTVYNSFSTEIRMTGDRYKLFKEGQSPVFIVNDITFLSV